MHPQANEAAREFARWLLTPEAAKAMEDGRRNEIRWPIPQCPWLVHVTQAQAVETARAAPRVMLPPETRFDGKIEGAVAVMPTVRRTAFSLVS